FLDPPARRPSPGGRSQFHQPSVGLNDKRAIKTWSSPTTVEWGTPKWPAMAALINISETGTPFSRTSLKNSADGVRQRAVRIGRTYVIAKQQRTRKAATSIP